MNDEEMMELKRPIIDACIKNVQKNGWSDAMGILWGTLFLESEPMSLDILAEKTGYSKTTVRSNMDYLESFGITRRVVGPLGKQHRYKQHRYALVTDVEAVRPVFLSNAKEGVNLILKALLQIKKTLGDNSMKETESEASLDKAMQMTELEASLAKSIQSYEETSRILDLISQFTSKELIEILERNKNRKEKAATLQA